MLGKTRLTDRQRAVLEYIINSVKKDLRFPTIIEMTGHFGFSSRTAIICYFDALKKKGWLENRAGIYLSERTKQHYKLSLIFMGDILDQIQSERDCLIRELTCNVPEALQSGVIFYVDKLSKAVERLVKLDVTGGR